jgi:hypothetical protein
VNTGRFSAKVRADATNPGRTWLRGVKKEEIQRSEEDFSSQFTDFPLWLQL